MGIYEKKIKKSTHKHIYYSYPHTCKIINKIEQSLDLQIKPQDRFKRLKKNKNSIDNMQNNYFAK